MVFDGYDGKPSTKDMVHLRSAEKHSPHEVSFTDDMISSLSKGSSQKSVLNRSKLLINRSINF